MCMFLPLQQLTNQISPTSCRGRRASLSLSFSAIVIHPQGVIISTHTHLHSTLNGVCVQVGTATQKGEVGRESCFFCFPRSGTPCNGLLHIFGMWHWFISKHWNESRDLSVTHTHTHFCCEQQKDNGQSDWERFGSWANSSPCRLVRMFHFQQLQWARRFQLGPRKKERNDEWLGWVTWQHWLCKTILLYLESIKINFIQGTVDIRRSVCHFGCLRVKVGEENLLPPTERLWQCFFFAPVCGHSLRIGWASGTQLKNEGSTHTHTVLGMEQWLWLSTSIICTLIT